MTTELEIKIATLATMEALELMSKKAGVEPKMILEAVINDPEGNTANYLKTLVGCAMKEVPNLLKVGG